MQLPGKNSRIFLARIEWTAGNSCPHQKDLQGRNPPTRLKSLSADPAKAEYAGGFGAAVHVIHGYLLAFLEWNGGSKIRLISVSVPRSAAK